MITGTGKYGSTQPPVSNADSKDWPKSDIGFADSFSELDLAAVEDFVVHLVSFLNDFDATTLFVIFENRLGLDEVVAALESEGLLTTTDLLEDLLNGFFINLEVVLLWVCLLL